MNLSDLARAAGVSGGTATVLLLAVAAATSFGVTLPLALGVLALVGTDAVARRQHWGGYAVAAAALLAAGAGLVGAGWGADWLVVLATVSALELGVAFGLKHLPSPMPVSH